MLKLLRKICHKLYILTIFCTALLACTAPIGQSEQTPPEQARSANSFVDSIGVAVHLNYGNTAYRKYKDIIKPRLQELGIRHIRGGVSLKDTKTQQKFNDLAKIGIKSTLVMEPRRYVPNPEAAVTLAKVLSNSIEALEGPNEWDINPDRHPNRKYKGQNFPEGLRNYQADLYSAIKGDPATVHLDVLGPSMANPQNTFKLGRVACDISNMHHYPGNLPSKGLDNRLLAIKIMCGGNKPVVVTECGYHNAIRRKKGMSEKAAAKYLLRLFLEYFNRGIERAYTYELIDLKPDIKEKDRKFHFGLLRHDGSPKPDFIAIKNLLSLLKDTEGETSNYFPLQSLDYILFGKTANVHHTLLQKKSGIFYLILWQEVPSFDLQKKRDISVPERFLKLILNTQISQASVYQPINSITPIRQYTSPKQLEIRVPDHPVVIELVPNP